MTVHFLKFDVFPTVLVLFLLYFDVKIIIWVSNTIQFFLKFIYFVNGNVIWGDSTSLPDEGTTKYVTIDRTEISVRLDTL